MINDFPAHQNVNFKLESIDVQSLPFLFHICQPLSLARAAALRLFVFLVYDFSSFAVIRLTLSVCHNHYDIFSHSVSEPSLGSSMPVHAITLSCVTSLR